MTIEKKFLDILAASTEPALVAARKSYGYVEQDDEKNPTALPLLIVQRAGSEWFGNICGTVLDGCFVSVAVIHIARDAAESRKQADAARFALVTSLEVPQLESEGEEYDPDLRAWFVTQTFRVFDDSPTV